MLCVFSNMSAIRGIIAVFATFFFCYIQVHSEVLHEVTDANFACDNAIKYLFLEQEILDEIEPLQFPNIKHGKLETKNGKLYGLPSIEREGNCSYYLSDHDVDGNPKETAFVTAEVAVRNITFEMDYKIRMIFISVSGSMSGKIRHASVRGGGHLSDGGEPILDFLKVTSFDDLEITRISAVLPQSSFVLKTIANIVVKDKRKEIIKALEDGVINYLGPRMKDITLN